MKRIVSGVLVVVVAFVFAAACSKKDDKPIAPSGPAPAATSTPTRACTPTGYGSPTVVPETGDAGESTGTAQDIGSATWNYEIKVLGALTEGSDNSDFYEMNVADAGGYYVQIACFNTDGGTIDYDIIIYNSAGTQVNSYTTGTYLVGTCCFPSSSPGTYYIEIRRNSGSGPYSLHIYAT